MSLSISVYPLHIYKCWVSSNFEGESIPHILDEKRPDGRVLVESDAVWRKEPC